ncbi:MAG: HNH endonuclease [Afipia felis]|nr:HNH endonuclease [Afipia felis]
MSVPGHLTAERLREVLSYNPETGNFTWLMHRWLVGKPAGTIDGHGYLLIRVDGRLYRGCRLVWLYMTGEWPSNQMDHINMDRSDDRWSNLREATNSQNNMNRLARKDNKSGIKGVYWSNSDQRWVASITSNGHRRCLGYFKDKMNAAEAYAMAAQELHKDFARITA